MKPKRTPASWDNSTIVITRNLARGGGPFLPAADIIWGAMSRWVEELSLLHSLSSGFFLFVVARVENDPEIIQNVDLTQTNAWQRIVGMCSSRGGLQNRGQNDQSNHELNTILRLYREFEAQVLNPLEPHVALQLREGVKHEYRDGMRHTLGLMILTNHRTSLTGNIPRKMKKFLSRVMPNTFGADNIVDHQFSSLVGQVWAGVNQVTLIRRSGNVVEEVPDVVEDLVACFPHHNPYELLMSEPKLTEADIWGLQRMYNYLASKEEELPEDTKGRKTFTISPVADVHPHSLQLTGKVLKNMDFKEVLPSPMRSWGRGRFGGGPVPRWD